MLLLPNEFCESSSNKIWNKEKKKQKKTIYYAWKTEVRKTSIWQSCNLQWEVFQKVQNYTFIMPKPQRDVNALSLHSGQFWLFSIWRYFM